MPVSSNLVKHKSSEDIERVENNSALARINRPADALNSLKLYCALTALEGRVQSQFPQGFGSSICTLDPTFMPVPASALAPTGSSLKF